MPTYEVEGLIALGNLKTNSYSLWSDSVMKSLGEHANPNGITANARLRKDLFEPHIEPKFRISMNDPIFAIGSCFARVLEERLVPRGFEIKSYSLGAFDMFSSERDNHSSRFRINGICNKYNTFSILQHFAWLDDSSAVPVEKTLLEVGDDLYQDPHVHPIHKRASLQRTLERREAVNSVFRLWQECQVIVITLGLTETWYDQLVGCYLNVPPAFEAVEREPKRFRFMSTTFNENLDVLEKLYDFLMQRCPPSFRIIVTVSPVAPIATFGAQDVVISHMLGKSTLRAVAAEWSALHDNIEYFPAYEIILNSSRPVVFKQDRAHITFKGSAHVADVFERAIVEGGQPSFLRKERQKINSYEQYLELYKTLLSGERDNARQQLGLELDELRAEMLRWEHIISKDNNFRGKFRKDLWQLIGLDGPAHT